MQKKNLHDSSLSHKHARQSPVGGFKQARGVGTLPDLGRYKLLGAAIPAIIVSPAVPMYPLNARHACQRRDGIDRLSQPRET